MKTLILQDERTMCAGVLKEHLNNRLFRKTFAKKCRRLYFAGDSNLILDYLFPAAVAANTSVPVFESVSYVRDGRETGCRLEWLPEELPQIEQEAFWATSLECATVYFFADCVGGLEMQKRTLETLRRTLDGMKNCRFARCVVSVLLPRIPAFSDEVTSLAERELSFYLEKKCEKTPEMAYYLELEALCRQAVAETGVQVTLLRYDNVFAPDRAHTPSFALEAAVDEAFASKTVTITEADGALVSTLTYIRTACQASFTAAWKSRPGHVYNVGQREVSLKEVKEAIHAALADELALSLTIPAGRKPVYSAMNTLKSEEIGLLRNSATITTGIRHLVSYRTLAEYDTSANVSFYSGRIKTIQALEIDILQEIDRICRKHNINYFLAGGTLLGAVRSGGCIPWDDDLDIGMLREDFEKFRKVCKAELSPRYSYSCHGTGAHYTIDKIRLDDSYFSTNFSNRNVYPDGIFVDILIYDKTSNVKLFQKLHGFILTVLTTLIYIKWFNKPRGKYHYRFTQLMLPVLRIIPWCVFEHTFHFFATLYRHKKNARFLVDTVGKKVNDGPLPNEGLDEVVYVDFEGIKAPIPVDPIPYLHYAYGPNYMQKPVFSQQQCPHNFARIDLGKYVFDNGETIPFRAVDVRGELFESEEER